MEGTPTLYVIVALRLVKTLTEAQVDTRFMVDVGAYHMLHDKEASEEVDSGSPISESSIDGLKDTEEFILQLPPTIEGFNMTEKKWSTFHPHHEEQRINANIIQSTFKSAGSKRWNGAPRPSTALRLSQNQKN